MHLLHFHLQLHSQDVNFCDRRFHRIQRYAVVYFKLLQDTAPSPSPSPSNTKSKSKSKSKSKAKSKSKIDIGFGIGKMKGNNNGAHTGFGSGSGVGSGRGVEKDKDRDTVYTLAYDKMDVGAISFLEVARSVAEEEQAKLESMGGQHSAGA